MSKTAKPAAGEQLPDRQPGKKTKIFTDERGMIDMPFLLLTILLVCIGLIMMFSASYASSYAEQEGRSTYYFGRQGFVAVLGIALMLIFSRMDYHILRLLVVPVLIATVIIMLLVLVIGLTAGGATRWINLFGVSFQPSEIAKFTLVLAFSVMISSAKDKMQDLKQMKNFAFVYLLLAVPLLLQKHLSGSLILAALAVIMLFVGGAKIKWLVILGAIGAVALFVYLQFMSYADARVVAWRDPWSDPQDAGFQIVQSLYAIGSGGLMGLGLGHSRQKYLYLPEEHNDYIFPIVCEELGFVGAVVIILLFVFLIIRGYWIAMHARDRFGALLAVGLTSLLALQVFLNIGVVTNLLPATGISLPFFSYGGTALLMQLFEMGVILSVSRQSDNQLLA